MYLNLSPYVLILASYIGNLAPKLKIESSRRVWGGSPAGPPGGLGIGVGGKYSAHPLSWTMRRGGVLVVQNYIYVEFWPWHLNSTPYSDIWAPNTRNLTLIFWILAQNLKITSFWGDGSQEVSCRKKKFCLPLAGNDCKNQKCSICCGSW